MAKRATPKPTTSPAPTYEERNGEFMHPPISMVDWAALDLLNGHVKKARASIKMLAKRGWLKGKCVADVLDQLFLAESKLKEVARG